MVGGGGAARPPSGQFGRRRAALQSLAPSASMEAGGALLRTLLQQQQKVRASLSAEPVAVLTHLRSFKYQYAQTRLKPCIPASIRQIGAYGPPIRSDCLTLQV